MRITAVCLFMFFLFVGVAPLGAGQFPQSASISATATVVHPIGLFEARESAELLGTPAIGEFASRWFLYIPRGAAIVLLDQTPIEIETSGSDNVISALDLTAYLDNRPSGTPVTVTVIYSEN